MSPLKLFRSDDGRTQSNFSVGSALYRKLFANLYSHVNGYMFQAVWRYFLPPLFSITVNVMVANGTASPRHAMLSVHPPVTLTTEPLMGSDSISTVTAATTW